MHNSVFSALLPCSRGQQCQIGRRALFCPTAVLLCRVSCPSMLFRIFSDCAFKLFQGLGTYQSIVGFT